MTPLGVEGQTVVVELNAHGTSHDFESAIGIVKRRGSGGSIFLDQIFLDAFALFRHVGIEQKGQPLQIYRYAR